MSNFEQALALLLLTTALSVVARWLPWPRPITYVLGGVAFGLVPAYSRITFDPDFFFLCFLPPLLFSDGWLKPLREFVRFRRSIFLLATGLVVFTTVAVGLVAHALVPTLPLAMAFALGAVVSPTDAVAMGAVTERLKLPSRLAIILSGESLMNDATGLVAFKFALAAAVSGTFSLRAAGLAFLFVALGGLAIGLIVAYAVGRLRDFLARLHGSDPTIEITLSLLTPYAAYLLAAPLSVSAILAVVAAGLYSGWRDPVRMDAETRQTATTVWSVALFWLNGLAFVLLGLQFPKLLAAVGHDYSVLRLVGLSAAIAGVAMVARLAWFFPGAYLPFFFSRRVREREERPPWQSVFVGGWAGMRGTVTLAAALSIPFALPGGAPFPGRSLVIFLAFGVIASTLLLQGTTTAWLVRYFGLREDDSLRAEEQLARSTAVRAGLAALQVMAAEASEENEALGQVIAEYEQRIAVLSAEGTTRASARRRRNASRRFRIAALDAERQSLDALWRRNAINDGVYRPLQQLLDYEETLLRSSPTPTD